MGGVPGVPRVTPASVGLGELVEREVAAHRRRTALDADGVRDAVRDARAVAGELELMISRLETAGHIGTAAASTTQ
jgi:hypothetical protein